MSLGVDTLADPAVQRQTVEVSNGIANPFCSEAAQSQVAPTRTKFPTEQFRFSSHYWDHASFNGRLLYSGASGM